MDRKGTSGLLLTEYPHGGIRVEYIDYGVDFFGDRDFESFYELTKENADKLRKYIAELGYSNLKEGLIAIVGETFSDDKFCDCCKAAGAEYSHMSWS